MINLSKSPAFIIKVFPAIIGMFSLTGIFGQTYTTLTSGDWNNTTNVWSTNGLEPCNCAPNETINGFDVIINHNINLTRDITMKGADSLIVRSGAQMSNSSYNLTVNMGFVYSEPSGPITIKDLDVRNDGEVYLNGGITASGKWHIDGKVTINCPADVLTGDLRVKDDGRLTLKNRAVIAIATHDLLIDGIVQLDTACISVINGNVDNRSDASVTGFGKITAWNGDVTNSGNWALDILWCAVGKDVGMPTDEDCITTCSNVLPIELLEFYAEDKNECVQLNWITTSEINNDFFSVERSADATDFNLVITIKGAGNSHELVEYQVTDDSPAEGINYYRLKQTDFDGEFSYSNTIGITKTKKAGVHIFPNPLKEGPLELVVDKLAAKNVRLVVVNSYNETIHSEWIKVVDAKIVKKLVLQHNVKSGLYFLVGYDEGDKKVFSKKLIVY